MVNTVMQMVAEEVPTETAKTTRRGQLRAGAKSLAQPAWGYAYGCATKLTSDSFSLQAGALAARALRIRHKHFTMLTLATYLMMTLALRCLRTHAAYLIDYAGNGIIENACRLLD